MLGRFENEGGSRPALRFPKPEVLMAKKIGGATIVLLGGLLAPVILLNALLDGLSGLRGLRRNT